MKDSKGTVKIFLDEDTKSLGEFSSSVAFELDTRALTDGPHVLKIMGTDVKGREGMRLIPFVVRNGPNIDVEGLRKNETVDGIVPIIINAYGKGDQEKFIIYGSESPRGIPSWVIVLVIFFVAWALYYLISYFLPIPIPPAPTP